MRYFVQFSTAYDGTVNPVQKHLAKVLPEVGLPYNPHFLEHPTWISWAVGATDWYEDEAEFVLLEDYQNVGEFLHTAVVKSKTEPVRIFGSVLDANKDLWYMLIPGLAHLDYPVTVNLGGYITDPEEWIESIEHVVSVRWFSDISLLSNKDDRVKPDHRLLAHIPAIPRLTMSTGCNFICDFCTIPRRVTALDIADVVTQVASFKGLDFEYIYLDDKTFGQAENYRDIGWIYHMVLEYNPKFKGFIVQTTVGVLDKHYIEFADLGVVFAEIGVEIPDDKFLEKMHKPYRVHMLEKLMNKHKERWDTGKRIIRIIPNILFGVPGDDYEASLSWLDANMRYLSHVNPFILSFYEEAKNASGLLDGRIPEAGDDDETQINRSWLTASEVRLLEEALDSTFFLVEDWLGVR